VVLLVGVNANEQELAFVLLGNWCCSIMLSLELSCLFRQEKEEMVFDDSCKNYQGLLKSLRILSERPFTSTGLQRFRFLISWLTAEYFLSCFLIEFNNLKWEFEKVSKINSRLPIFENVFSVTKERELAAMNLDRLSLSAISLSTVRSALPSSNFLKRTTAASVVMPYSENTAESVVMPNTLAEKIS